jgi:hypothetical protein
VRACERALLHRASGDKRLCECVNVCVLVHGYPACLQDCSSCSPVGTCSSTCFDVSRDCVAVLFTNRADIHACVNVWGAPLCSSVQVRRLSHGGVRVLVVVLRQVSGASCVASESPGAGSLLPPCRVCVRPQAFLPDSFCCIAEGLDYFYRNNPRPLESGFCALVDFQSCGQVAWKVSVATPLHVLHCLQTSARAPATTVVPRSRGWPVVRRATPRTCAASCPRRRTSKP